jgi:hypothetical protein
MPVSEKDELSYRFVIVGVASALVVLFIGAGVVLAVGRTVPTELWAAASALSGALVGILVPPKRPESPGAAAADAAAVSAGEATAKVVAAAQDDAVADAAQAAQHIVAQANNVADLRASAAQALGAMQEATRVVAAPAPVPAAEALAANEAAAAAGAAPPAEAPAAAAAAPQDGQGVLGAQGEAQADAIARHTVLAAAASAAEDAHAAVVDAVDPVRAPTTFLGIPIKTTVDLRTVFLLVIFVVALAVGIALAFHAGDATEKMATVRDTAVKSASGTLIALAAAAGGALVGLAAPAAKSSKADA